MAKFKSYEELAEDTKITVTSTDSTNEFSDLVVKSGKDIVGVIRRDDSPEAIQVILQTLLDKTLNITKVNLMERLETVENEIVNKLIPEVTKRENIIANSAYQQGRRSKRIFGIF